MKRIKKILASLMVAVMVLTAAPLSGFVGMELNLDWLDFSTEASAAGTATVSLYLVSEDSDSVTLSVVLTEGERIGGLEVMVTAKGVNVGACTNIAIDFAAFSHSLSNKDNGMIAVASIDGFGAGTLIAEYTFAKLTSQNIIDEDFEIIVKNCADAALETVACSAANLILSSLPSLPNVSLLSSGDCGNSLKWCLYETGDFYIRGEGLMNNYSSENPAPWNEFKEDIKTIEIGRGVTRIGNDTFIGCKNLTNVYIPDTVTIIGNTAFRDCTSLSSISIPGSVTSLGYYAFYGCTAFTLFNFPSGVKTIGNYAFGNCSGLETVIIPDTVSTIARNAFYKCTSLTEVCYAGTQEQWDAIAIDTTGNEAITDNIAILTASGTCGTNLSWYFVNNEKLVISGTGEMDDYSSYSSVPWRDYRSSIKKVTIGNGVTSIGSYVFYNCESLTSITIPDSVTIIGDCVFAGCSNLESITIPNGLMFIGESAFGNCKKIYYPGTIEEWESIIFGSSYYISLPTVIFECNSERPYYNNSDKCGDDLNWILYVDGELVISGTGEMTDYSYWSYAPWNSHCSSIKKVTIGDGVTSIGSYAFYNCTSLTSITIPNSVTSIGEWAFDNCKSLTSITIPDSVTSIGSCAFEDCTSLASITIPDSVTSIGDSAFNGCTSLTSITIPDSVTSIGSSVFYNCTSLTSITIPDSVTSIGGWAFLNCTSLTSITIPDSVTSIGKDAFYNCTSLTSITIGNNVTSIGTNAFAICEKLEEVIFNGDSIIEFGEEIFYGSPKAMICCEENSWLHFYASSNGMRFCLLDDSKIPTFEIKNNVLVSYRGASENVSVSIVNQIGYGAFEGNSTVENIEIAKSVNVIYNNAFKNCSALKSVYIPQSVTSIGATAFNGCDDVTIWCYAGSYADEYAQTHNIDVEYITLSIDDSIIYLAPNEQTKVTYSLNTHLADNMSVVWESTDKTIVTVDSFGNIKGIKAGTAVVVVASKDGTMRDYCVVKVVGIEALSTLSINFDSGIISGLSSNTKSLDGLITMTDSSCNLSYTTLGTDSVVYVERDNEIVDAYTILVYGDLNGDSWYDGQDAVIVSCLANGMLTKEDVSEAVYMAADCNHDGVIDQFDVDLLNEAGTLLANVDQSKPAEVLMETSSDYVEYISLIDQSPEIEIEDETDTPEADVETEDTTPEQDAKVDIFEMIMNFIRFIFEMIFSRIPVP